MFSANIQTKLKDNSFILVCPEENIWIWEDGEDSVTVSGDDYLIEAIWQNYEGTFKEVSSKNVNELIKWSKEVMNK